jgi:putative flippase GtrA
VPAQNNSLKIDQKKLLRFMLAGGPAFALAVPLNYLLVHRLELGKPLAYALVLAIQMTVNFFICHAFVFEPAPGSRLGRTFLIFVNGNILFRLADWLIYAFLTRYFGLPYLGVQLFNVVLFAFLKYEFTRRVFEHGKSKKISSEQDQDLPWKPRQ